METVSSSICNNHQSMKICIYRPTTLEEYGQTFSVSANPGQLNKSLHKQKHTDFTVLVHVPFLVFTFMGVVVGSSATFREISTGRILVLLSGATSSLISFTWMCSMVGDRSVALITATLSGTSFLPPDYKTINRTSYNIVYNHLFMCILSCPELVLEKSNYTPITYKQGRMSYYCIQAEHKS